MERKRANSFVARYSVPVSCVAIFKVESLSVLSVQIYLKGVTRPASLGFWFSVFFFFVLCCVLKDLDVSMKGQA